MLYLLYIFVGALGGIIIGAIGSGSSLIILPFLTIIFSHLYSIDIAMKLSVATCLSTLIVGTFSGAKAYAKTHHYDKKLIKMCFPSIILGSILSPVVSHFLSGQEIKAYISVLLILVSLYKLYQLLFKKKYTKSVKTPNAWVVGFCSLIFTICSGIAGVALGILMIPFLSMYGDHKKVVGTNLMLAFPYALISTISYFIMSYGHAHLVIPHSIGYIYLPAFTCIAVMMAIFPMVGKKLADNVSIRTMQLIFYVYLFIAGFVMIYFK